MLSQVIIGLLGLTTYVMSCPGGTIDPVIREPSSNTKSEEKRLIQLSDDKPPMWLDQYQIEGLIAVHANFIDITEHQSLPLFRQDANSDAIPETPKFQSTVTPMLNMLSPNRMETFIQNFSNFRTRFYFGPSGVNSQRWLLQQANLSLVDYPGNATVREFDHWWPQNSVIARLQGSDRDLQDELVIIGAHQDSINKYFPGFKAPGADDNASGSAIVLEMLRVLVASKFVPRRSIEFQWYAAEEVGLRGSGAIAKAYAQEKKKVVSMLNYDVAGYNVGSEEIGIYTDKTSPKLNAFLRTLTETYCEWKWKDQKCGYGCSDHASWTRYGYPASMAAEVEWNPYMHTPRDNTASVHFQQVLELSKLGLAYLVEMSA